MTDTPYTHLKLRDAIDWIDRPHIRINLQSDDKDPLEPIADRDAGDPIKAL